MFDLFLVSTPLQLISAAEAREHFNSPNSILVVVKPGNKRTENEIRQLIPMLQWDSSAEVIFLTKKWFYFLLRRTAKYLGSQDIRKVFIGHRGSWAQELLCLSSNSQESWHLDDGTATINHYCKFLQYGDRSELRKSKRVLLNFLGIPVPVNNIGERKLFTMFPLEPTGKIVVERMWFEYLKGRVATKEIFTENAPYIGYIGQPNSSSDPLILQSLKWISRVYPQKRIIYFSHRKEAVSKVRELTLNLRIEFHHASWPLEIELHKQSNQYVAFYGTVSTALFTLKAINPRLPVYQLISSCTQSLHEYELMRNRIFSECGIRQIVIDV